VPNPQNGQAEAIAAAEAAFAAGIRTFILAVGNDVGLAHQQDMANAGAGKPLDGSQGDAPFYGADDPTELAATFREIITGVRECTFALDGVVNPGSAGQGKVTLNGIDLVFGDANGWSLVDPQTIKLDGSACQTFLTDPDAEIAALFPCGVVIE
jgi:hypothetical protein